jgi:hypothetical protein
MRQTRLLATAMMKMSVRKLMKWSLAERTWTSKVRRAKTKAKARDERPA